MWQVKKFTFSSNKQSDIDLAKNLFQREVKTLQSLWQVKKFTFSSNKQSDIDLAKNLFQREVKTLQNLNGHPHIPRFVEYIEENQELYLIQQYINGETLGEKIKTCKVFAVYETIQILETLLNILVYIHDKNIIHRDIKRDNIMIDNQGNLFLIDFGAVKERIANTTKLQVPATRICTPEYAPKEQINGFPRKNSDIYALGITIIELMTGSRPEDIGDDWHTKINSSDELKDILRKMIHDEYEYRYQSAQDVINDLQKPQTVLQTQQVTPTNQSHDISPQSAVDMILFGLLFTGILIIIFNAAMLPGVKKKEDQKRQFLSLEKVVVKTMEIDISNLCPNLVKLF
ncbi:serine/threonine-protein kinase [Aphanizomenon sp. CS-733/32]|uniref:serine/threonine-protein kinase n=1 Tax=Aphanizomenon sp. CS-733/32 TaxID=3021715 RepID=UPI0023305E12|nr:serine/threonine-protein kinase [Aphanizomenon sp. CS-733/32]MDB9309827.1 serine/threonine-protein kinase [Aphanizomenon sp. CS-733/32]